jgi:hypothetical protein
MHVYSYLGQGQLSLAPVRGVSRLTNAERYKIIQVAQAVGADPDLLAATISLETGGTFNPAIVNRRSGATGLIQFIPSTARLLGTSTSELRSMNVCEQLDWVLKFYQRVARSGIRIRGDEYVAVFAPDFLGRSGSDVVYRAGQSGYDQNRGLDLNGDGVGVITVGELRQNVINRVPGGERIAVTPETCRGREFSLRALIPPLLIAGAGVALFWGTLQPVAKRLVRRTRSELPGLRRPR